MPGAKRLPGYGYMQLPSWYYLGGESITLDGASHYGATIPSEASIIEVRAEAGELYFALNVAGAAATSPGYIPEDQAEILGPLANLSALRLYSTTASTVAHLMYFREA